MEPTKPKKDQQSETVDHILAEHKELRERLAEVRNFLEKPRPRPGEPGAQTWSASLAQMLVDLHDRLFRHFRDEELDGGFASMVERRAWAHPQVQVLMDEHKELLTELKGVIDATVGYSTATDDEDRRIRRRMRKVLSRLESHEQRETDLLQRLYYDDLGIGD